MLQRRAGLQATGGETAAPDEKTLSPRQPAMSSSALLQRSVHNHPKAQVQVRVQKARSMETLVPLSAP